MFTFEIETSNAAFRDDDGEVDGTVVADMLDQVSTLLNQGFTSGVAYDFNGNPAGSWSLG